MKKIIMLIFFVNYTFPDRKGQYNYAKIKRRVEGEGWLKQ